MHKSQDTQAVAHVPERVPHAPGPPAPKTSFTMCGRRPFRIWEPLKMPTCLKLSTWSALPEWTTELLLSACSALLSSACSVPLNFALAERVDRAAGDFHRELAECVVRAFGDFHRPLR